jgi:hypothetical protein
LTRLTDSLSDHEHSLSSDLSSLDSLPKSHDRRFVRKCRTGDDGSSHGEEGSFDERLDEHRDRVDACRTGNVVMRGGLESVLMPHLKHDQIVIRALMPSATAYVRPRQARKIERLSFTSLLRV